MLVFMHLSKFNRMASVAFYLAYNSFPRSHSTMESARREDRSADLTSLRTAFLLHFARSQYFLANNTILQET
jgi:hypothetical protein